MAWKVDVLKETGVIETVYAGLMATDELREAFNMTFRKAREHGAQRFLADCRGLKGGHSVIDLYLLVEKLVSIDILRTIKEALLMPTNEVSSENVRFWETAARNKGFNVRVFVDRDVALEWLTAPDA